MTSYRASFWCSRHNRIESGAIPVGSTDERFLQAVAHRGRVVLRLVDEDARSCVPNPCSAVGEDDKPPEAAAPIAHFSTLQAALRDLDKARRLVERSRARLSALGLMAGLNETGDDLPLGARVI